MPEGEPLLPAAVAKAGSVASVSVCLSLWLCNVNQSKVVLETYLFVWTTIIFSGIFAAFVCFAVSETISLRTLGWECGVTPVWYHCTWFHASGCFINRAPSVEYLIFDLCHVDFYYLENDTLVCVLSDIKFKIKFFFCLGTSAKSATLAGWCRPGSVESLRPGVQMSAQDGFWIPVYLLPTRLRHLWPSPPAIGWPWSSRFPTCETCFVRRTFICTRRPFELELTSCLP